tara:strand:- start:380 stop:559 length:180 start_codon:yes stop_codon:yes gene_type:complete
MKPINIIKFMAFVFFTQVCGEAVGESIYGPGEPQVKVVTFISCIIGAIIAFSIIKSRPE